MSEGKCPCEFKGASYAIWRWGGDSDSIRRMDAVGEEEDDEEVREEKAVVGVHS